MTENTLQSGITSEKNNTENTDTEKISTDFSQTDFEDYITGVVARRNAALFEPEALKAQAVAAVLMPKDEWQTETLLVQ